MAQTAGRSDSSAARNARFVFRSAEAQRRFATSSMRRARTASLRQARQRAQANTDAGRAQRRNSASPR